jgi:hypothetical protein
VYYIAGENSHLYASHSLEAANALAATLKNGSVESFDASTISLDFGGILLGSMEWIEVAPLGHQFKFLGHHLTQLVQALHSSLEEARRLGRPFLTFLGHPLGHCMDLTTAESLMHTLSEKWEAFVAVERHNLEAYEGAVRSLSGFKGVDVSKEIDLMDQTQINGH